MTKLLKYGMGVFILTLFLQCYKPREGCRDPKAVNYDVMADVNCCCKYPQLILQFSYYYDTTEYRQSTIYTDAMGRPYYLRGFQLNLHGFRLLNLSGEMIEFKDTVDLSESLNVFSKNVRIGHFGRKAEVGKIDVLQDYTTLRFKPGIDVGVKKYKPDQLDSDSPLKESVKNVYHDNKWYDGYVTYVPDTSNLDSLRTVYFTVGESEKVIAGDFMGEVGENLIIELKLDLFRVLSDFDIQAGIIAQRKQLSEDWVAAISRDTL